MTLTKYRFHIINVAILFVLAAFVAMPLLAGAGTEPKLQYFDSLFTQISKIISNILIPLVLALALLLFIWGVIQYFILGADDEAKRETGRAYMLYAIIGLVAIVAVWGLVELVLQIVGIDRGTAGSAPKVPGSNQAGPGGNGGA